METYDFKVVVAGPFAAGKTTFIGAISDIPVVGTEQPTTGEEATVKGTTTVGMEYGSFSFCDGELEANLYVHGVPGQRRFSFMWDIVGEGMDGLVVLVDAEHPETWDEAADVAMHFRMRNDPPVVVAVNRAAHDPTIVDAVRAAIAVPAAAWVGCDVTDPDSAAGVLIELLVAVLETLDPTEEHMAATGEDA